MSEPAVQYALPLGGFSDTAFTDNRTRLLHRWVPWIAGFSGSFVEDVIVDSSPNGRALHILDPFAGVGGPSVSFFGERFLRSGGAHRVFAERSARAAASLLRYVTTR